MIETFRCTATSQWKSMVDGHILGTVTPPAQPTTMPFFGAAFDANATMTTLETQAGRSVGLHRTYSGAGSGAVAGAVSQAATDVDNQRVPWVSVHSTSVGTSPQNWDNMNAGAGDVWWASLCKQLGAIPGPVMLSIDHEPENDSSVVITGDVAATSANIAKWVRMQDRLYLETKKYPNIKFGPILMGYGQVLGPNTGTNAAMKLSALWPGAFNSGDFLAFDPYNYYGAYQNKTAFLAKDQTQLITSYKDTAATYGPPLDAFAKAKGIQWALAENGITDAGAEKDIVDHGTITHFTNLWNFAKTTQGRMIAYSYFNTEANSRGDWKLAHHTNPVITKQKAFINALKLSPDWRAAW